MDEYFVILISLYVVSHMSVMFTDGQKIAKNKQISKTCASIRNILANYNRLCIQTGETELSLKQAYDVNSPIWSTDNPQHSEQTLSLSQDAKHDILQSELSLLENETKCVSLLSK